MVFIHAIAGSNPAATTKDENSHSWFVFCFGVLLFYGGKTR